jgi:hypothetical protein
MCFKHMIINHVVIDVLICLNGEWKCTHHWFTLTHLQQMGRCIYMELWLLKRWSCPCVCHENMWGKAPHILYLGTNGGEWSASHFDSFTPYGKIHSTHWIGDWVAPTAGLDILDKRNVSCSCQVSVHDSTAVQLVVQLSIMATLCQFSPGYYSGQFTFIKVLA